ncbi:Endonuclease III [hydrothermal vent metagenome]|uniref:Endonuclease III n=1 Tax=hydrothermal vent metagenome TaxID=652676 RepID=A0A3B1BMQ6_9ZZZZ
MNDLKSPEFDIQKAVKLLRKEVKQWKVPVVTTYSRKNSRPAFQVLISCLLSLRTRDEQTAKASRKLFAEADSPEKIADMPVERIEKLIYPVGFYRNKAKTLKEVCQTLLDNYQGQTPDTIDQLVELKGVGRKTANLVVTLGFGKPGICVDTHVHRICNIWGYVNTKTPDKTETALRERLPRRYWIEFNDLLVTFGQNLCKPVSPICSRCKLSAICPQKGVGRSR